tara:strand:- start:388 stop:888 length:501 start_codon:yes stop_codon:yes gene_type:complete
MKNEFRTNGQIMSPVVLLVLEDGTMKGEIRKEAAMRIADDSGLDLVEVKKGIKGSYPTCKLMDYGKMKYAKSKKNKHVHNHTHIKEIKFSVNTSDHDVHIKHDKITALLKKKHTVKYIVTFRGREVAMKDEIMAEVKERLNEFEGYAAWDDPLFTGRIIIATLKPK